MSNLCCVFGEVACDNAEAEFAATSVEQRHGPCATESWVSDEGAATPFCGERVLWAASTVQIAVCALKEL